MSVCDGSNCNTLCVPAAQRSAHELPMVEKQDMDSCSVLGGQQMILTGQNFSSDSKVIFLEKTQGEQHRITSHTHNLLERVIFYFQIRVFGNSKDIHCPETFNYETFMVGTSVSYAITQHSVTVTPQQW